MFMDLSTAQQILVVILSCALALFLVLGIVTAVLLIRLVQTLRMIAGKAEHLVTTAEAVGDAFKKAAGPVGVLKFVRNIADMVSQHKHNKE
jgi:hypothetical protein